MSLFGLADILLRPPSAGARDPARMALIAGERRLTYAELTDRVLRLATGLHRRGFRRGDVIALYLKNRVEYLEMIFAAAHMGGVLVPVNYLLRPGEVAHIVADSAARWLVTETSLLAGVATSAGPEFLVVVGDPEGVVGGGTTVAYDDLVVDEADAPAAVVESSETALLQYTSGTTGFPKGAVHTHATVLVNTLAQVVDFEITSADTHVVVPSLSWAAGLHCLTLGTIWRRGTVVLKPTGGFDADDLADLVERHHVTTGMFAPSVLRMILESRVHERHDLTSLRLVLSGGEPVTPAEIGELQRLLPAVDVRHGYGVSEFPSVALHLPADDVVDRGGAAGWSTVAANIRVARPGGGDAAVGEHGEIVIRSPATSIAYLDGTSAVVDGWLHTGDRGYLDDAGIVHVSGRSKEMIVSGGLNVYPAEVERVIAAFPGVIEVAVIGVPDRRLGEVGHAFVVCDHPATLDREALRRHAEHELAGFKVPRMWTVRADRLPRTVTGKLRRSEML
ncbi:class I adenylate-forming enzyme family protein [Nocardioides currus]|uniref:O-succinylbenzoate--CoA ligase n=1 Tax=Nocardioides currus TaxID=2133958 RepID=A0A2R7Z2F0_9ACTN|nr:AMP-binding protein [Nocardioides currus]PUA82813.1 o-succinylbenzoate--CoA ligase [Nocardioides currus]